MIILSPLTAYGSTQAVGTNFDEVGDAIGKIPTIVDDVRGIWKKLSLGNIQGAIEAALGAMGLLNPAYESSEAISDDDNPYANPETPEEVYEWEQHAEIVRAQFPQQLSQVIFSRSGQEAMVEQIERQQSIQAVSEQAVQAGHKTWQSSNQIAQTNTTYAGNVRTLNEEAQSAQASQDVLKALAAQNEYLAQITAGNSNQLTQLGELAVHQSTQLNGVSTQLSALHGQGQTMSVMLASQNYLLAGIDGVLERQQEYQQYKDDVKDGLNQNLSGMVFVPGLFREVSND